MAKELNKKQPLPRFYQTLELPFAKDKLQIFQATLLQPLHFKKKTVLFQQLQVFILQSLLYYLLYSRWVHKT